MVSPIEAKQETVDRAEQKKIDKQVVMYVNLPETDYKCEQCIYYKEKKCALYGPTVDIKPYGGCNMWIHGEPNRYDLPFLGLLTKLQTGYTENKNGFSCKRCEEFLPAGSGCKKVNRFSAGDDPGMISPNGCCNRWGLDPERGTMPLDKLMEAIK